MSHAKNLRFILGLVGGDLPMTSRAMYSKMASLMAFFTPLPVREEVSTNGRPSFAQYAWASSGWTALPMRSPLVPMTMRGNIPSFVRSPRSSVLPMAFHDSRSMNEHAVMTTLERFRHTSKNME